MPRRVTFPNAGVCLGPAACSCDEYLCERRAVKRPAAPRTGMASVSSRGAQAVDRRPLPALWASALLRRSRRRRPPRPSRFLRSRRSPTQPRCPTTAARSSGLVPPQLAGSVSRAAQRPRSLGGRRRWRRYELPPSGVWCSSSRRRCSHHRCGLVAALPLLPLVAVVVVVVAAGVVLTGAWLAGWAAVWGSTNVFHASAALSLSLSLSLSQRCYCRYFRGEPFTEPRVASPPRTIEVGRGPSHPEFRVATPVCASLVAASRRAMALACTLGAPWGKGHRGIHEARRFESG